MSGDVTQSVLRRLLERVGHTPDPKLMSPCNAFKNALPKAADHAVDLPLVVLDVEVSNHTRSSLLEKLEKGRLYMLIQSGDDRLGIVVPDAGCLGGLIEIQTIGDVSLSAPDVRLPTRTDASMVEPFVDAALTEFAHQLEGDEELSRYIGFSYFKLVEDMRHLPIILPEDDYACYEVSMGMGRVAKPSKVLFAFPNTTVANAISENVGPSQKWTEAIEAGVMSSRARVNVVLHRVSIPLDEVSQLKVGQEIMIPRKAVQSLCVEGSDGKTVARGKLGQANGFRAVKISSDTETPEIDLATNVSDNPLEALGAGLGPIPVTSTPAGAPLGTGLPEDFADISPPPEEEYAPIEDLPELDGLPPMGDLPPLDNVDQIGDLTDMNFPHTTSMEVE